MAELGHVTVRWREARTSALLEGLTDLHSNQAMDPTQRQNFAWVLEGPCTVCSVPRTWVLPPSLLCPTFLIGLVDCPDLLVVPRGHDLDEDTLIRASPLEERAMVGAAGASTTWGHDGTAVPGKEGCRSITWQKSTSSKWPQGQVGINMEVSNYAASGVPAGVTGG